MAWGGVESHQLDDILQNSGVACLLATQMSEAEGLVGMIDDQTLVIPRDSLAIPRTEWPLYMAAWHVGISKLEQLLNDLADSGNAPIGAGPFSLIYPSR